MENEETNIENQADKPEMREAPKQLDPLSVELVKARKAAGLTQNELHVRTGISRDTIKGYETGRSMPGSRELRVLCEALGISANRALWGREDFQEAVGPLRGRVVQPAARQLTQQMMLIMLVQLLSQEEVGALFTLMEPLAIGRHGRKKVEEAMAALDIIGQEVGDDVQKATESALSVLTEERIAEISAKVDAAARRRGPRK